MIYFTLQFYTSKFLVNIIQKNELWNEWIRNSCYRLKHFIIICFDLSVNLEVRHSLVPDKSVNIAGRTYRFC